MIEELATIQRQRMSIIKELVTKICMLQEQYDELQSRHHDLLKELDALAHDMTSNGNTMASSIYLYTINIMRAKLRE